MSAEDTIVAIATPKGYGGIGILRLSGPKAYAAALSLIHRETLVPRQALYTGLYSHEKELIDKGLVLYFPKPNSFTGEDVIEIQAHGSPVLLDYLLSLCLDLGLRMAQPGEFSQRAFLNDKIDLLQAEAIADLISAQSLKAARMAFRSLEGEFSKKIDELNEKIIHLRLYIEANLDFPDEDLDFSGFELIHSQFIELLSSIDAILNEAKQGALMREGATVVIAGKPNAGKSTLINHLAAKEVAIVTSIPGTTRDVMKEYILIGDLPVHIIDTAGLRQSEDPIEIEGIKRAWNEIKKADCLLWVMDIHQPETSLDDELSSKLDPKAQVLKVFNKIDLSQGELNQDDKAFYISAKTGLGRDLN